ncbi:uncharacterized protein LOC123546881 isoform X1 [Mercenaria mercenaria]|uniref:uncharacterized protein LOC123546881 isoform X1 n=1 Tax=Mercenaria mercenaria TaxID=6596 RepID=UPI00234EF337|nr:uncharacterized protein LOC123546881 isoform X1 [Mercenaria mercenaria]
MRSMENGANCIIPVLLEPCEIPVTLKALTYIDATAPDIDIPAKIVSALIQGEADCLPYSEMNENGYSITLQAQTTSRILHCLRIPTKYQFKIDTHLLQKLESNKIKVSERLLEDATRTINQDSVMNSYDYLRRRNIVCWSVLTIPFFVLLFFFLYYMTIVTRASRTPFSEEDMRFITNTFASLMTCMPSVYGFFALLLICVLPIICRRRKAVVRLQKTLLHLYEDEFISNNILLIFSGRKYKLPTLHIMRYNIKRCRDYLTVLVKKKNPHSTCEDAELYARSLIHAHLEEISLVLAENFESLPERPYNRHTVKKGRMCMCQIIENEGMH